jgi:uncharacterized protein (TIGR02611 family)
MLPHAAYSPAVSLRHDDQRPLPARIEIMRRLKAIITTVFGFTVLLVGIAMLVLPGPGLVVIGFGLVILSAEFVWARRALDRMKEQARKVRDRWGASAPPDRT